MGARSRRKGACGEREFAKVCREKAPDLFPDAERGTGQARRANECADVTIDDEHWPEVKRQRQPSALAALRQAVEAAEGSGRIPIAACRADRDPLGWTITLQLDDWIDLVRAKRDLESVCARVGTVVEEGTE